MLTGKTMSAKSIVVQMDKILKDISNASIESIDDAIAIVTKTVPRELKSTSPKKYGDYSRGWAAKRLDKKCVVIYNKSMPGLTHLLEDGHMGKNQYGEFHRVKGIKHIDPAAEKGAIEFYEKASLSLDDHL